MKTENEIELLLSMVGLDFTIKEKPYICKLCGRKFKTNRGAWRHLDDKHYDDLKLI